ncbi:UDP-N-acetylmuramoyl-L-alanyl-D-glutamate--2,6-diaminopimelate ligase [Spirochaeta dissipatitropha]
MLKIHDIRNISPGTEVLNTAGPESTEFHTITQDSRLCSSSSCFVAIEGLHSDGHSFITDACAAGATLIVHEKPLPGELSDSFPAVCFIQVADSRRAFSWFSASLYKHPSRDLPVIGITGTDGKSTTVSLLHQLLNLSKCRTGYISTVSMHDGIQEGKNHLRQSTPEADEIHSRLMQMKQNACSYAIIESTSHGLSPKTSRLADIHFDTAIYTNITHEHLEFHGSFEQYRSDKAELFRRVNRIAILNSDDPSCEYLASQISEKVSVYRYSCSTPDSISNTAHPLPDFWADEIKSSSEGSSFNLCSRNESFPTSTALAGEVNIANILAAAACAHTSCGLSLKEIAALIPQLRGPEGRMTRISAGQNYSYFVDYAHTPGSFEKLFPMLRELSRKKLICVFGSAGMRDTAKRKMQGSIADRYADIIILTDEDPREEDSMKILEEIADGIHNKKVGEDLFLIPDRYKAIEKACSLASSGDLVISLGKGHEGNIQYADHSLDWNETQTAFEIIKAQSGQKGLDK